MLLHTVSYLSDATVLAVGDREIWTLTGQDTKLTKTPCNGMEPQAYASTSSMACVALRRNGATDSGVVWMFDKNGELVKQVKYSGELRSLSARSEDAVLLTDTTLYELQITGVRKQHEIPSDALLSTYYGDKPMVLTFGELKRSEK